MNVNRGPEPRHFGRPRLVVGEGSVPQGVFLADIRTVADAMLTAPKRCDRSAVVADLHELFQDEHVHCALVTDGSRLLSVVMRDDLDADLTAPASTVGTLRGRTVAASANLDDVHRRMVEKRLRRLAVVTETGRLLGLLCLKRTGIGFCSDAGVAARAAARHIDAVC